ncbi:MAG: chemotaxis protein CheX [Deltaproteobacteria bacterium]|nr:chemotaxis protein CheX [Deltaproteobacteria bacterium]
MDVKQALMGSVNEVLDKMAFMFFDEASEDDQAELRFDFVTFVRFTGLVSGTLNIMMTESSARVIARNLLGIRDEDELFKDTLQDALREFTNLVMGRTMTLLNPSGRFDMHVPELVGAPSAPEGGSTTIRIAGSLDDEPIQVLMHYQEP